MDSILDLSFSAATLNKSANEINGVLLAVLEPPTVVQQEPPVILRQDLVIDISFSWFNMGYKLPIKQSAATSLVEARN